MNSSESSELTQVRGPSPRDGDISFWEVLAVLVRGRRRIAAFALLAGGVAVGVGLVLPRSWEVQASFRPQGAEMGLGQLSSLASQFGVSIPGNSEGDSPEFYQELIRSRAILERVALRYFTGVLADSARLESILELDDSDLAVRTAEAITWLGEEAIATSVGRETGIVTLTVTTQWPQLSAQLAHAILEELNRFNTETRRSQAAAERGFAQERREAARSDLTSAEGALKAFLVENRSFDNSPALRFEHDRLQREVQMRQQIYTTLSEAYEQARISEVRDTPVITVLQAPYLPPEPEGRGLVLKLVLGVVLGGMLGVAVVFLGQLGAPARAEERRAYDEVKAFWSALRAGRIGEFF